VFRGVNTEIFPLALVYDWAGNGNIIQYLKLHPNAPRIVLVMILCRITSPRLTPLSGDSCCKSRRVYNIFIRSASRTGISKG